MLQSVCSMTCVRAMSEVTGALRSARYLGALRAKVPRLTLLECAEQTGGAARVPRTSAGKQRLCTFFVFWALLSKETCWDRCCHRIAPA